VAFLNGPSNDRQKPRPAVSPFIKGLTGTSPRTFIAATRKSEAEGQSLTILLRVILPPNIDSLGKKLLDSPIIRRSAAVT
jgi:hypothetical protein